MIIFKFSKGADVSMAKNDSWTTLLLAARDAFAHCVKIKILLK